MKKSSIFLIAILLSCTFLLTLPSTSAASYQVIELWNKPMAVNDVAVSGDGNYIVAVNNSGVYFFSRDSSQPRWWYTQPPGGYFGSVAISLDGEYVVAGYTNSSDSGFLYYFNDSTAVTGAVGATWISKPFQGAIDNPRLVAMSDDGNFVMAGANNYTGVTGMEYKYFNDSTARFGTSENATWGSYLNGLVSSIDMSADGNYVVLGGEDPTPPPPIGWVLFFKDSSTSPQGWGAISNLLPIIDVVVSNDGYAVAAVSPGTPDTLYYWEDATNLPPDSPANWTNLLGYGCVDMSSDGDIVVAGTYFPTVCGIHLWDGARTRTGINVTETWNSFAGQLIPDIGISRDGMIIAATAVNMTEHTSWTYFLTSSGGLIGQFAIDAPGMVVSMSSNGSTTAVATLIVDTVYVYGLSQVGPVSVGGEILGLNGLELIAPYLMAVLLVAGATVILLKRRRY